jgi:predicted nucleotidyltransferase
VDDRGYTIEKINGEKRRLKEELVSGMQQYDWTNCSKVIKAEVSTLQTEFSHVLDAQLSGIYLHGSLALGGFQPTRSDIDMIVTTSGEVSVESKRAMVELLLRISKFPSPVDVWFLAEQGIIPFRQPLPFVMHYSEALREDYEQELRVGTWQRWNEQPQHDPHLAIYLTVLYRKGIRLSGLPIVEAFPVVPEQAFRDALIVSFREQREHRLRDLVAFVLNACRVYAYLRDGTLLSKDEGGTWGLANLPEAFHPLIHQSLALYRGDRLGRPVSRAVLDDFTVYMEEIISAQ